MKLAAGVVLVALVVAACSSEVVDGAACPEISGNYSVTSTRAAGTCDAALDPTGPTSMAMRRDPDGSYTAVIPSVEGGCPGTLDIKTCKFTSTCVIYDARGTTLATSTLDYTFTSGGFSGTTVNGLRPPAVAKTCEVTYRETGSKL